MTIKKWIKYRGTKNGPTLSNMHLVQGQFDEHIKVEGEITQEEREEGIIDAASFEDEIKAFKK